MCNSRTRRECRHGVPLSYRSCLAFLSLHTHPQHWLLAPNRHAAYVSDRLSATNQPLASVYGAIKMLLLRSYMQDCPTSLIFFSGAFLFAYSEVEIHKAGLHRSTMFCGYYIFLNVSFFMVLTYSFGGRTKHFWQLSLLFIHDRFRQTVQRHAFLTAAFAFVLYARPIAGHKQQHLPINAIVIQSSRALRQV